MFVSIVDVGLRPVLLHIFMFINRNCYQSELVESGGLNKQFLSHRAKFTNAFMYVVTFAVEFRVRHEVAQPVLLQRILMCI